MSRIGKKPIAIPQGVQVDISENNIVRVKGPKGELTQAFNKNMIIEKADNAILVKRPDDSKFNHSLHGLTRTLIANMIEGVTKGYEKSLDIVGVGYRASKQGNKLVLNLGYSHPIEIEEEPGIEIAVDGSNKIIVKGIDKQRVGQVAAMIRDKRRPDVYKGKGIRYTGEVVRLKEGKTGKK
ncbi:50S ribosomal protein L6 [Calorimonas adulescens]|uniref:Large ribosomal subunit protein uL6 n=1 Tax=Calorimonas adulescens TaxID=2606906 RepID=A0A5D8QEX3_9THEO|nr:50S ribosomal protein L6 [Calorimonas adulescens]TZE82734.1 50S ribosomal protein L6 [Calorimonas adulescens]